MIEGAIPGRHADDYNEAKAEKEAYGGAVYDKVYAEYFGERCGSQGHQGLQRAVCHRLRPRGWRRHDGVYTKAVAEFGALIVNNLDVDDQGTAT